MRSRRATLAAVSYLLVLGVGGAILAETAWYSVTHYRSEYAVKADLPAGDPLTDRLVFIVLDGVRVDAAARMPRLQQLAARGSSGVALVEAPTLSNPSRATLSTGAPPEVNGVTNNARYNPVPVQSIFSSAKRAGVPVSVYGSYFWRRAFPDSLDESRTHAFEKELGPSLDETRLTQWQTETCADMDARLPGEQRGLIVVGLTAADEAGHDFGGESQQYQDVVAEVDRCLGRVVDILDDGATTFVVVADHGHIQRRGHGGHGGREPEVVSTPLVLAGQGVAQSSGWTARHLDVAPTICALLGLPMPANNEGVPLWQALQLTPSEKAALEKRVEQQHALLRQAAPDRGALAQDERRSRALAALLAAGWFSYVIIGSLRRAGTSVRRAGGAALFHLALYFALYWAFGLGYSLSDVVREEYLNWFFARNAAAALIAFVATVRLFRCDPLRLGLIVTAAFGFRIAWVWYDTGLIMHRILPDLSEAFMAYMDLLHNLAAALTAVALALLSRRATATAPPRPQP